mmetsp:Transcript_175225/g.561984  ORF Transcript_175225/g.561984 Transcript_175225/m.561984 type:complete len:113 (-) Transcript_175225:9-347(-)
MPDLSSTYPWSHVSSLAESSGVLLGRDMDWRLDQLDVFVRDECHAWACLSFMSALGHIRKRTFNFEFARVSHRLLPRCAVTCCFSRLGHEGILNLACDISLQSVACIKHSRR